MKISLLEILRIFFKEAQQVDKILESDSLPDKYSEESAPLLGVPFSCKESIWVKNMPNTTGLLVFLMHFY